MSLLTLELAMTAPYVNALADIITAHTPGVGGPRARCTACGRAWPCETHTTAHRPFQDALPPEYRCRCARWDAQNRSDRTGGTA